MTEQKDCHICRGSGHIPMRDNRGNETGKTMPCDHGAAIMFLVKDAPGYAHTHTARAEIADTLDQLMNLKYRTMLPRDVIVQINELQAILIAERDRKA